MNSATSGVTADLAVDDPAFEVDAGAGEDL
jgi:hypothetical protein